jgi:predicted dehydrogenase
MTLWVACADSRAGSSAGAPIGARGTGERELTGEQGGGLLLDLGSHLIDQALLLFGSPSTVYAEVAARRPGAVSDDDCFLALDFPGGVCAHLWMSTVTPAIGPRFRVWGSRRALEAWGLDPQEDQLRRGLRPGAPGFGEAEGGQRAGLVADGGRSGSGDDVPLPAGRYGDFYVGMAAAILGGSPVPVPAEAGREVLALIEAARRSAATGAAVAGPGAPPAA